MTEILQVGQQTITASELLDRLVYYQMLPQIRREILIDRAISDIECTPEEQNLALKKFLAQNQLTNSDTIQSWLEKQALTLEQLERQAVRQFKTEKFKQITWGNKLESYFLGRKNQLDRVVYSLLRVNNPSVARELHFRIQEGEESFAELARKYSQGPEAQTGGVLGPVALSSPHPILAQMLSKSQPGQLLPLVRIEDWIVIVRLEKIFPAQLDESMRQCLLNELFAQWLQQESSRQIAKVLTEQKVG
jgi:parvulin-like peptidyl-prolyl isomerase